MSPSPLDTKMPPLPTQSENNVTVWSHLDVTVDEGNTRNRSHLVVGQQLAPNMTDEEYLAVLNTAFAVHLFPAVVVLAVLMVVGVVGNVLVLFMYTCRTKRGTVTLFIQALAVFDLLSCGVAIPGEIIDMINNYTFGRHPLCQVVRTVNLFCTVSSGATLVVVAIDRYKRICCPLRPQITPKGATIVVCICATSAFVISLPTVILYGSRTVPTNLVSVNGTDCSISDQFVNTMFPIAYNGLQMLLFLVGAVILMVLYSLIGSKVCQHVHQYQVRRKSLRVDRFKLPPEGTSKRSSYSGNAVTSCRVENGVSGCVKRRQNTELALRFQPRLMQMLVDASVSANSRTDVKKNDKNNDSKHDTAHNDSTNDRNSYVHNKNCEKLSTPFTKSILEAATDKCYSEKLDATDVYLTLSGEKIIKLANDKLKTNSFVEEEHNHQIKQEGTFRIKKQHTDTSESESFSQYYISNSMAEKPASVLTSTFKRHSNSNQDEVPTNTHVHVVGADCLQREKCSEHAQKWSERTIETTRLGANNELQNDILRHGQSTTGYDKSSVKLSTEVSAIQSEKSRNVQSSSADLKCHKLSDPRAEHRNCSTFGISSNNSNIPDVLLSNQPENSQKTFQANTFSAKIRASKKVNQSVEMSEDKNKSKLFAVSHHEASGPTEKTKQNSIKLNHSREPAVVGSNYPSTMSTLASGSDGPRNLSTSTGGSDGPRNLSTSTGGSDGPRNLSTSTGGSDGPRNLSTSTGGSDGPRNLSTSTGGSDGPRNLSTSTGGSDGPRNLSTSTGGSDGPRNLSTSTGGSDGPRNLSTSTGGSDGPRNLSTSTGGSDGPRNLSTSTCGSDGPRNLSNSASKSDGHKNTSTSASGSDGPRNMPTSADGSDGPRNMPTSASPNDGPRNMPTSADGPRNMPTSASPNDGPRNMPTSADGSDGPRNMPTSASPNDGPRNMPPSASPNDGPRNMPTSASPNDGPRNMPTSASPNGGPRNMPISVSPNDGPRNISTSTSGSDDPSNISMSAGGYEDRLKKPEENPKVKDNEHNYGSGRTTLMLFLITIIYVLSFLPHLVLMALKALNEDTLKGHGSGWDLAQNLLIRSYFINSTANPIIYSFFSRNFFRQCRS